MEDRLGLDIDSDLGSGSLGRRGGSSSSRRSVLSMAGIGATAALTAACAPPPVRGSQGGQEDQVPNAPPPTPQPGTSLEAAQHLARRATFGATHDDVQRIESMGAAAWLDQQLSRSGLASAENLLGGYVTLTNTNEQNYHVKDEGESDRIVEELDHATLLRAVYSEQQLYEVMCDFWTNHFNIWRFADWLVHLKTRDNETVIRKHALGKFSDLLMASAKSPAMLVYLDNYQSSGTPGEQVNENYGRELLELHTLGIVDGAQAYSEADVVGVAKVLSGWGISWDAGSMHDFQFHHWHHSREAVSILGEHGRALHVRTGVTTTSTGWPTASPLIRFLAHHKSTARYLATKLVRRFVSDTPPASLVQRLASIYLANDTAIAPMLRELFLSKEFGASANQKVKRPVDWMFSALRATGAVIPTDARGKAAKDLRSALGALGQPLNERTSPDGWPDVAAYWVGSDGMLKRWGVRRLPCPFHRQRSGEGVGEPGSSPATTASASNAALVTWLGTNRFGLSMSSAEAAAICTAVGAAPSGAATQIASETKKLQGCVGLLLAHPGFHRR
ncbi:MAG: DUF1800 domain-containing protein [Microthrixaceae bacterium]|nr:DUF1800 domain-containing protein [Microthrixaceae bacterium]